MPSFNVTFVKDYLRSWRYTVDNNLHKGFPDRLDGVQLFKYSEALKWKAAHWNWSFILCSSYPLTLHPWFLLCLQDFSIFSLCQIKCAGLNTCCMTTNRWVCGCNMIWDRFEKCKLSYRTMVTGFFITLTKEEVEQDLGWIRNWMRADLCIQYDFCLVPSSSWKIINQSCLPKSCSSNVYLL